MSPDFSATSSAGVFGLSSSVSASAAAFFFCFAVLAVSSCPAPLLIAVGTVLEEEEGEEEGEEGEEGREGGEVEEEEEAEEDCDGATFCGGALGEGVRDDGSGDGTAVAAVLLPFAVPVVFDVSAVPASSTCKAGLGAVGLSAGQGGAAELPVELPA
jgi:hypothetical protein